MATKSLNEQVEKFDSIVSHFIADPSRRTTDIAPKVGKNMIEPDGRVCAYAMFGTLKDAQNMQYLFGRLTEGHTPLGDQEFHKRAQNGIKSNDRITKKWGNALTFMTSELHDNDAYWTPTGLSALGKQAHNIYRTLLTLGMMPADYEFRKNFLAVSKTKSYEEMQEYTLEYARNLLLEGASK